MKDKIGITLTFDNILKQDHIKLLPITHLQILFQNKLQFLYPTEQDLYNVRSYLKNKDIETIVHISVQLCISRSYGKNLTRINQELRYAQKLNAQYIIIHTGTSIGAAQMPKLYGIWAAKICQNYLDKKSHYLWHPKLISASQINYGIPN